MRIRFASGGGVTGPAGNRSVTLDTDQLPSADAAELRSLVLAADLPALSKRVALSKTGPDEMYYEVTLEENDRTHTVSLATGHAGKAEAIDCVASRSCGPQLDPQRTFRSWFSLEDTDEVTDPDSGD